MNAVTKRTDDLLRFDADVRGVIEDAVAFWPNDGQPAQLRRDLLKQERAALTQRRSELERVLRPIKAASEDMKRAAECVAQLFLGFPSMRNIDAQGMVTAYIQHMSDLPLYAVRAACEDVAKGRVKDLDPDWPPTSVRLVEVAQPHVRPQIDESIAISKTLAGKIPPKEVTPAERERIAFGLRRMAEDMKDDLDRERLDRVAETNKKIMEGTEAKILQEYRRLGIEPRYADAARTLLLSPALAGITKVG